MLLVLLCLGMCSICVLFFFNDTATTEIYTLSLHDALPIYGLEGMTSWSVGGRTVEIGVGDALDRKSTRLNSSHQIISYAVFCLTKKTADFQTDPRHCRRKRLRTLGARESPV